MTQKQEPIHKIIQTYLEGLHNPCDDSLYNELRAKRDTENLKEHIAQHYISKAKLLKALDHELRIITVQGIAIPDGQYINIKHLKDWSNALGIGE